MKLGLAARSALWGAVLLAGVLAIGPGCGKKKMVGPIKGDPTMVVATVDGEKITLAEVDRAVQQLYRKGRRPGVNPNAPEDSLQLKAIDDLISQRLIYLQARKAGAIPTDQETADFVKGFWQQRFPSEDSFVTALKGFGLTKDQFVRDWQMNTGINKYVKTTIEDTVKVTPEQARAYYDTHPEEFQQGESVRARHILLRVGNDASPEASEQVKTKLQAIAAQIKRGADFGELAKTKSEDPGSGAQGGELPAFVRGQMVAPFDSVAFALAPGAVSDPVRTQFGWHLIKVDSKSPAGPVPFNEIQDRLINGLTQKRVGERIQAWVEELKQKAKIKRKV